MSEEQELIHSLRSKASLNVSESITTSSDEMIASAAKKGQRYASPSSLPTTLTRSYRVGEVPTDCWLQLFQDCIFVGISQLQGKTGNLILCQARLNELKMPSVAAFEYETSYLLGVSTSPLLDVYAKRILQRIMNKRNQAISYSAPSLLLAISLDKEKGSSPEMFHTVLELVINLYQEALQESR